MAITDKGTISNNALSLALATQNPNKALLASPICVISFSTDLADGAEGLVLLTYDSVTPANGGSPQATCKRILWPANVRWDGPNPNVAPQPRGAPGDVAIYRLIRDAAAGYFGRLIVSGAGA